MQFVRQIFATFVLLGYVLLVPLCFFGSAMMAHADTEVMSSNLVHHTDNCGMPLGCGHANEAGAVDDAVHHISMYFSLTQTPPAAFSLLMTILVLQLLVTLGVSSNWFRRLFLQTSSRIHTQRTDEPHIGTKQKILAWLSLFEASPNFA